MAKGLKNDQEKAPTQLLPWPALEGVANVLGFGAKKYAPWNWYQGIAYSRCLGAAIRHIFQFLSGEDDDPETGLSHIDHAIAELMFVSTFVKERRHQLDDRAQQYRNINTSNHPADGTDFQLPVHNGEHNNASPWIRDWDFRRAGLAYNGMEKEERGGNVTEPVVSRPIY